MATSPPTSPSRPTSPSGPAERPHPARGRRAWRWALVLALLPVAGGLATSGLPVRPPAASGLSPSAITAPAPSPVAGTPDAATAPSTPVLALPVASPPPSPPAPVFRLPGPVPAAGRGTFVYGLGQGEVLGRFGVLRRYRVAVETGTAEDVEAFGAVVDRALANPASWIASGRVRLQRVPGTAVSDFTVYLATAGTARRMCAAGGVNIRIGGRPYTSCRTTGKVIINLDRWRLSVEQFVAARMPLDTYRMYVINHEIGHELGHRHERCPGPGRLAPVMAQQTISLRGCLANPWPYVDGRRYTGPRL